MPRINRGLPRTNPPLNPHHQPAAALPFLRYVVMPRGAPWNKVKDHPVVIFLGALVAGGVAGAGLLEFVHKEAQLDVVPHGSYTLNKDIEGRLLRRDAAREITGLIDIGEALKSDDPRIHRWLLAVRIFVHELGLEKDSEWEGRKVSTEEETLRWAILDPSLDVQVQKTLGVLYGLRAAFSSRAS
jgi:hypothetical protein